MANFTEVEYGRTLTAAEQTSVDGYVSYQTTAGTTDGNLYTWNITGSEEAKSIRMWSTFEAGNGLITLVNSFTPAPTSAKIY